MERGLLTLYTFDEGKGQQIQDRSGVGSPLDLKIESPQAVVWRNGELEIRSSARIRSAGKAAKVIEAIRRSGQLTVEAWVTPADAKQDGPARLVSISNSPNARNLTLGQDKDRWDVRLRTRGTSTNGIPSTASARRMVKPQRTHVVYTRDTKGAANLYVNGRPQGTRQVSGNLKNWDSAFPLLLANEASGDRPWKGKLHLVAIYGVALSPKEVALNYRAGERRVARVAIDPNQRLFEQRVAAILSHHCLECHDSATRKGGLDLSRKDAAFAGGDSGPSIAPGKLDDSLLWHYVESDEMPLERTPLNDEEKQVLKKWIAGGAAWSLEQIDPAVYETGGKASENWIRRLTVDEYIETVRRAVGVDISKEARELLPDDLRADGFSNTAYNLNVDLKHVEAYGELSRLIARRMDILKFASRFTKDQSLNTDATTRETISKMGRWLLRGPLTDREVTIYSGIATTVAGVGGDFEEGMRFTVEAMLQSPRFIYRIEDQRGGGSLPVGDYELASRLSYILWGGPPDEELLRAAEAGELSDLDRLTAQAQRMLENPRAVDQSKRFVQQWLNLGRLENMQPNRELFPNWTPQLGIDMQRETLAFFEHLVWERRRPLAELLNAQFTFATPQLAKHYGLPAKGDDLTRYDLAKHPARGGLLTQGSVLTVGGDEASMVSRGLFVMHELLRGSVKDPPPCVDTTPPPTKAGLTQRSVAESRIANKNCGGCHAKFEPLAFGLEKFNGLGAFAERDHHGNPLRDDGEILFPGEAKPVQYKSAAELMNLLAASDRVRQTITWKLTQFALGRPLGAGDAAEVARIHQRAEEAGGTYQALMTAIVTSELVRNMQRGWNE